MTRGESSLGAILAAAALFVPGTLAAQEEEGNDHDYRWAAGRDTTVRNEFGPSLGDVAAACRGACGPDCPDTCKKGGYMECLDASHFRFVRTYKCGTNDGCREHDDCLDACSVWDPDSVRMPGDLWEDRQDFFDDLWGETPVRSPLDRNFVTGECSRYCHAKAVTDHGPVAGIWARGYGPYDGHTVFEYTVDTPDQEEPTYRCPDGTKLVCEGGRGRCEEDEEPEDEPEIAPPAIVVGVVIAAPKICNDPNQPLTLDATVIGLVSPNVEWKVLSGPGTIDSASGELTPQSEGTVMVEAASVSDPLYRDQVAVYFGRCECSFGATLSGDTNRGTVGGNWAIFSTRGQASAFMGVAAGGPDYWQDLAGAAEMTRGLLDAIGKTDETLGGSNVDDLRRMADELEDKDDSGSTIGLGLVEGPVGIAGAAKIEVRTGGAIEPGFSGTLPVILAAVHTGESAELGGAPHIFRYDPESKDWPGNVTLMVHQYDGQWMQGTVTGDMVGYSIVGQERRARLHFSAEFTAGIYNPLRMEYACRWAAAAEDEGTDPNGNQDPDETGDETEDSEEADDPVYTDGSGDPGGLPPDDGDAEDPGDPDGPPEPGQGPENGGGGGTALRLEFLDENDFEIRSTPQSVRGSRAGEGTSVTSDSFDLQLAVAAADLPQCFREHAQPEGLLRLIGTAPVSEGRHLINATDAVLELDVQNDEVLLDFEFERCYGGCWPTHIVVRGRAIEGERPVPTRAESTRIDVVDATLETTVGDATSTCNGLVDFSFTLQPVAIGETEKNLSR